MLVAPRSSSVLVIYAIFATTGWLLWITTESAQKVPHSAAMTGAEFLNVSAINISSYEDFPHKIWQTGKINSDPHDGRETASWLEKNPTYRYEKITQGNDRHYVHEKFSDRPEIVDVFLQLEDNVLRADLARYMVLLKEGGLYSDLDTTCKKPIDDWLSAKKKKKVDLIIGIEGDSLGKGIIAGFTFPVQFAMWTMMAKPHNPIMEALVSRVVSQIQLLAEKQNTTISNIKASYSDVMDTTGPGVWTDVIYQGLSLAANRTVSSEDFTGMKRPKMIGSTLILPVTAFGAGLPHSNAGSFNDPAALVLHHFAGSWKKDHAVKAEEPAKKPAVQEVEEIQPNGMGQNTKAMSGEGKTKSNQPPKAAEARFSTNEVKS